MTPLGAILTKLPASPIVLQIPRESWASLDAGTSREWLVTNGLGGYASGTISGVCTRRYHGLLIAATSPPVGRSMLLSRINERVRVNGVATELSTNAWGSGAIAPEGFRHSESFRLQGQMPVWEFIVDRLVIEKRVWMVRGENTTCIRYAVRRKSTDASQGPISVGLGLQFMVNQRSHHAVSREGGFEPKCENTPNGLSIVMSPHPLHLRSDRGAWRVQHDWYRDYLLSVERERGYDFIEDLLYAGECEVELNVGESVTMVASTNPVGEVDGDRLLAAELRRYELLIERAHHARAGSAANRTQKSPEHDALFDRFALAADQFIVARGRGTTVIAGYPWFGDWGRDSMISFRGLFLSTGRFEEGASLLRTFAAHVRNGLIPNRFADDTGEAEYNTADASLWFIHAVECYRRATNDTALIRELWPRIKEILDHYRRGTSFGIRMDESDGLIACGLEGSQVTWMDARVGQWVVTPRRGKPVEINSLWHCALRIAADIGRLIDDDMPWLTDVSQRVHNSFARFWNEQSRGLFDVLDAPEAPSGIDASVRPNQLFAASLFHSPLTPDRQRAVVDQVRRELAVPLAVRTLSPRDQRYRSHYGGDQLRRDAGYHQGTAWPWVIGALVDAHRNCYGAAAEILDLSQASEHLSRAGVGSVSEVLDGDQPHSPGGCPFQAWSVAEWLRLL